MALRSIAAILLIIFSFSSTQADEYSPAFLELTQISNDEFDVLWKVPAMGGLRLNLHALHWCHRKLREAERGLLGRLFSWGPLS